jgi:hypothetical protein
LGSLALLSLSSYPARESEGAVERRLRFEAADFVSGDLLFRRGRSLISRAVLTVDRGTGYSHVGLVSVVGGQVWVLHAAPARGTEPGGAIAEPLASFLAPGKASAAALYRLRSPLAAPAAERVAWGFVRARIPFDSAFDLSTPERLYCTEMVWRAYREAGVDLAPLQRARGEKYLLPSRLASSPYLQRIREFSEEERKK